MAQDGAEAVLTFDLRGLVWGIQSEVDIITALCGRIDDHVQAVNAVRAETVRRLEALDDLLAAAQDPRLHAWLEQLTQAPLPRVIETFPDRLYGD